MLTSWNLKLLTLLITDTPMKTSTWSTDSNVEENKECTCRWNQMGERIDKGETHVNRCVC